MSDSLRAVIARGSNELLELAAELIRIPSVNPPGALYNSCVRVLARRCRAAGLVTRIVRVPDAEVRRILPDAAGFPRAMVLARWDVGAAKTVHLNAHFDVVPAASEGWKYGPERSEKNKLHPCLVPYEALTDSEKAYDRTTVMATLKAIVALGYRIERAAES